MGSRIGTRIGALVAVTALGIATLLGIGTSPVAAAEPTSLTLAPLALEVNLVHLTLSRARATLLDADGDPIPNATVEFTVGGSRACLTVSDVAGVATCRLSATQTLQVLLLGTITATFPGDGVHDPSSDTSGPLGL